MVKIPISPEPAELLLAAMTSQQLFVFFAGLMLVFIVMRSHRRKSREATREGLARTRFRPERDRTEESSEAAPEPLLQCERFIREVQGEIRSQLALLCAATRDRGAQPPAALVECPPPASQSEPLNPTPTGRAVALCGVPSEGAAPAGRDERARSRRAVRHRVESLIREGRSPREVALALQCSVGEVELALLALRQTSRSEPEA